MAEIINLRRARKARGRSEKEAQAAQNRLRFGASKTERAQADTVREKGEHHLDGHRLVPADDGGKPPEPE